MSERKQIKVHSVGSWKEAGKGRVLTFTGEDRVNYETWSEQIGELVKVGELLDADIEFSESEKNGQKYFHNKVTQVYIDGKPVRQKKQFPGSNSEEIKSMDDQARADIIAELYIAGKLPEEHPLVKGLMKWLQGLIPSQTGDPPRKQEEMAPAFKNQGDFYNRCYMEYKLPRTRVDEILKGYIAIDPEIADISQLKLPHAWEIIKESQKNA